MNVVFALSDHPFETALLTGWLQERPLDRLGIALLPRLARGPGEPTRLTWALLQWCLRKLVGVDRPWPRPGNFARTRNLDVARFAGLADTGLQSFVKARHTDLLISWNRPRHPVALTELPHLGAINVHPGAHPEVLGESPWVWELDSGKGRLSTVLHRPLDEDRLGPQLAEAWHEAEPGTTPFLHQYQAMQVAARLLPVVGEELDKGEVAEYEPAATAVVQHGSPDSALRRRLRDRGHPIRSWKERFKLLAGAHDGFVAHHERLHAAKPN